MKTELEKECLITLYLDTPKPLLRPFKDPTKHSQLESLITEGTLNPIAITGHAFIGLTDEQGQEKRFGYTCNEPKLIQAISGLPGEIVREDAESFYNEAIVWKIDRQQYNAAYREIKQKDRNPGMYKLFERNCATVAIDVLKAAKVQDIPTGKMGLTPHGLVLKKRLMLAKRRMEVLKFKIKNAVNKLFGREKVPTSELLESLRSKPIPVPIRVGTKECRSNRKTNTVKPFDVNRLAAKLAFTK